MIHHGGSSSQNRGSFRKLLAFAAALGVIGIAAIAGTLSGRWLGPADQVPDRSPGLPGADELPITEWPNPEVALVLSGQTYGYLLPCGCSRPQLGGLERRYNYIQKLKKRGWQVVAADLGDLAEVEGPHGMPSIQGLVNYAVALKALREMGYVAVGIGASECWVSLPRLLEEYGRIGPAPRIVAANLLHKERGEPGHEKVVDWIRADVAGSRLKIGVAGVMAPSVVRDLRARRTLFGDSQTIPAFGDEASLKNVLRQMAEQDVGLRVLLYQGTFNEAVDSARDYPQFQVILCLSDDGDAADQAKRVGETLIVRVHYKGKSVGVVGVFPGAVSGSYDLRCHMQWMTEEYETPPGQEAGHPILDLLEAYTKELRDQHFLDRYSAYKKPHPLQAEDKDVEYLGSAVCAKCHKAAYDVWKKTPHSHAYDTLVSAKRPSLRQYDGECVVCHVTGFRYTTGFSGAQGNALTTLKDVGCEACHGPGSKHVDDPDDPKVRADLNPDRYIAAETASARETRLRKIESMCTKCHDHENDVHWDWDRFLKDRWPKVEHHTPPGEKKPPKP
jgi:hypothetical protein